jgi:hypothetical protein
MFSSALEIHILISIIGAVTINTDLDAQLGENNQSAIVRLFHELASTYGNGRWKVLFPLQRKTLSRRLSALINERMKRMKSRQIPESRLAAFLL